MIVPDEVSDIRLSFCITTRNRADFLRQTIESILPQATEHVEIVIVDGASNDHTENVVMEYQREYPCVRYFRMGKNSGVDRDYNSSIERARGEYCWFMADDDLVKPGAVQAILEEISIGYSLMVLNAEDWNSDFSIRLNKGRLPFDCNRVYTPSDGERFFIDTAHHLSFIPSLVIRRDIWLSREREKYFGSWFAHVGVVFQSPLPGNALVIANPLIAIRNSNVSWSEKIFEIWMVKWPNLIWSFNDFKDSSKERICPQNPARNWRTLLAYRTAGAYSFNEYKKFIVPDAPGIRLSILPVLISVIPPTFINMARRIYHKILPKQPG